MYPPPKKLNFLVFCGLNIRPPFPRNTKLSVDPQGEKNFGEKNLALMIFLSSTLYLGGRGGAEEPNKN